MRERDRVKIAVVMPDGRHEVRGTVVHVSPGPPGDPYVTVAAPDGLEYTRHQSEILSVIVQAG